MTRAEFDVWKSCVPNTDTESAVRMIFLNRAAYGGIYRVNRQGQFNVPYSGDRNLETVLAGSRLEHVSLALQEATITYTDFEPLMSGAGEGALIYCDPPYSLPGAESSFRRYGTLPFDWDAQMRLGRVAAEACSRGSAVIVSNSGSPLVHALYPKAQVIEVERPHAWTKKRMPEAIFVLHRDQGIQSGMALRMRQILQPAT